MALTSWRISAALTARGSASSGSNAPRWVDGLSLRVGPFTLGGRGLHRGPRPLGSLPRNQPCGMRPCPHATLPPPQPPPGAPPLPGAPTAVELRVRDATGERRVRIEKSPFIIGRGADCDLILQDSKASRHHARIERERGALVIADDGSANGTFVERHPQHPRVLAARRGRADR